MGCESLGHSRTLKDLPCSHQSRAFKPQAGLKALLLLLLSASSPSEGSGFRANLKLGDGMRDPPLGSLLQNPLRTPVLEKPYCYYVNQS